MFRPIRCEQPVCFALQDQTISKEMPILGLAAEFQQWQEATRDTVSFLKRYENDCSESLNTSTEATSCGRVQARHSHQPNHTHPAWRSSTENTLLLHPTSSLPGKTNHIVFNLTGSASLRAMSTAGVYSHPDGGCCKRANQNPAPHGQVLPTAPV